MSIGIPVKLLHESCGKNMFFFTFYLSVKCPFFLAFIITLELITGELFRGKLVECQDNFNCRLEGFFCPRFMIQNVLFFYKSNFVLTFLI
jgi:hypothetical protein